MAFTYTGDLSTNLDKTRFYVGDTDSTAALFTDAEINGALAVYTTPLNTAAALADAQAAKYSRFATISIDGASVAYTDRAKAFRDLAVRLRAQSVTADDAGIGTPFVGGVSIADMDTQRTDSDREPNRFEVGMQDFPGTALSASGGASADDDADD